MTTDGVPKIITKADLSRRLGVTHGQVSHWVAAGLPVREDGRLDTDAAFAWVRRNLSARSKAARALAAGTARPAPVPSLPPASQDPEGDELRRIAVRRAQLGLEREEEERLRRAGALASSADAKAAWMRELAELVAAEERFVLVTLVSTMSVAFTLDPAAVKAVAKQAWRKWRGDVGAWASARAAALPELVSIELDRQP